jgi:hypothetical protein
VFQVWSVSFVVGGSADDFLIFGGGKILSNGGRLLLTLLHCSLSGKLGNIDGTTPSFS